MTTLLRPARFSGTPRRTLLDRGVLDALVAELSRLEGKRLALGRQLIDGRLLGVRGQNGVWSHSVLTAYQLQGSTAHMMVAILTEQVDNPGASITNAAPHFWPEVADHLGCVLSRVLCLEHYAAQPSYQSSPGDLIAGHRFDQVQFDAGEPTWRPVLLLKD